MLFFEALRAALFGVFRYSGRSDRLEQWSFTFLTAFMAVGVIICSQMGINFVGAPLLLFLLVALWFLLAHIALFVRRLHDNNRSGLYMLIPAAALSIVLTGWLGQNGYIHFQQIFFLEYGSWILRGGRIACGMCGSFLLWIFLSEGDEDGNQYGYPV